MQPAAKQVETHPKNKNTGQVATPILSEIIANKNPQIIIKKHKSKFRFTAKNSSTSKTQKEKKKLTRIFLQLKSLRLVSSKQIDKNPQERIPRPNLKSKKISQKEKQKKQLRIP